MYDDEGLPDPYDTLDLADTMASAYATAIAAADDRKLALVAGIKAGWY